LSVLNQAHHAIIGDRFPVPCLEHASRPGFGSAASVLRAGFTNVTTMANNITSFGLGMYPDPLPLPTDTGVFPAGGDVVAPATTAVFWVTLPVPGAATPGVHRAVLTVAGTAIVGARGVPVELLVRGFALPDAAHASQWTEADPFGGVLECNMLAVSPRPPGCPTNHTDYPHNEAPCLATATVDEYYADMFDHRINRVRWC